MSKRKGDYITVDDLIDEVGKDATRFIMLNRSSDVELDFDFDAVKEKSKDNPLYYVQYCYARISSVFRHIDKDLNSKIELDIIFQKVENLHRACSKHRGDWYFTGDYPTPGGNKVVNQAFINFVEGKSARAY